MFSVSSKRVAVGSLCLVASAYCLFYFLTNFEPSGSAKAWVLHEHPIFLEYIGISLLQVASGLCLLTATVTVFIQLFNPAFDTRFLSVGNFRRPVRCPQSGSVKMVDNRTLAGAVVLVTSAIHSVTTLTWKNGGSEETNFLSHALLQSSIAVFAMLLFYYIRFVRSNHYVYFGVFPWLVHVLVSLQCIACMSMSYIKFFAPHHKGEPMFGRHASLDSNCLTSLTIISLLLIFCLSTVQNRPYFIRPLYSDSPDAIPASAYSELCSNDNASDLTPLAPPRTVDPTDLVDTPEFSSSWFSRMYFVWASSLLEKGVNRQLADTDLYRLDNRDMPGHIWQRFQKHRRDGRSLITTLLITFAPEFTIHGVLSVVDTLLKFSGPFFIQRILRSIDIIGNKSDVGKTATLRSAYLDAFGLLFFSLLTTVASHKTIWIGRQIGVRLKCLLVSELSAKSLRRCSKGSWEEQNSKNKNDGPQTSAATDGKIMNLLTADFNRILDASAYMNNLYSLPVKLLFGIWYMYALLGPSALVGLTIYALFVPFSRMLFRRFSKIKNKLASLSDERVTVITELLQGIKAVKLFGWESRFLERVDKSREIQLAYMWKMMMAWVRVEIVSMLAPILILVSIFIVYVAVGGNRLTAEVAFTSISVFNLIRSAFERIPVFFNSNISGYVSLKRIDEYLQQAEVQCLEDRVNLNTRRNTQDVGFENAVLDWSINQPNTKAVSNVSSEQIPLLNDPSRPNRDLTSSFVLKDINVRFPSGGLSLVAGPTGSGKTSLLSALIGEMNLTRGHILLPTTRGESLTGNELAVAGIAYVAQEAWLRNATIRENILFGEPYDQQRYEEVLWMCALKPDLRILIAGDLTEIGERGITLSGGQKQRVALARAVYSSRRILLIDDCLSAVDAPTARHILTECLVGKSPLMQGRTRVLVTHHVSLCLPFAQHLVMLKEGKIVAQGTPSELMAQGEINHAIAELEKQHSTVDDNEPTTEYAIVERNLKTEDVHNDERRRAFVDQHGLSISMDLPAVQAQLFKDEERVEGYVKLETWSMYLTACGGKKYWVSALMFLIGFQLVTIFQDYWVRIWVTANERGDNHHSATFWIGFYMSIGFAGALWQLIQRAFIYRGTINACRRIHARLIRSVLRATPRFFDSTPLGRIINRFSRDMQVIDEKTINSLLEWMTNALGMLSIFIIISLVTPLFTMVALLVSFIYITLTRYYLSTSRELMRLGSNGMSPLLSLFSEIIQGVSTVRAFGASQTYIKEALNLITTNNRAIYMLGATQRWLALRVEAAGAFVSFACAVLLLRNLDWIDSGLAGFMLSYSLTCSDRMLWAIRNHGANELNMTAVERISQYLDIEQENVLHSLPGRAPPRDWPSSGETLIENLVVEYVPGTPVLHGISLYARHGEKIGVVGRTGAGKSTLSLAFMRFIEARSGRIVLDGVDISQIGLEELRRNVTIIPQDPVLFNGTIRFNLDPFDEYPDELVWDALKRAYLVNDSSSVFGSKDTAQPECMTGIFNSLSNEIKENGQNLSLGQRQLVALARALIRRSRLIVMDEATASVDFDTDSRIQRTIRGSEFANSTLFCVAHRLRTIIDYDRVLVLDNGRVAEFDTPSNLLKRPEGIFKNMCEQSGEYDELVKLSRRHHR